MAARMLRVVDMLQEQQMGTGTDIAGSQRAAAGTAADTEGSLIGNIG